jgi:hypothetical protein
MASTINSNYQGIVETADNSNQLSIQTNSIDAIDIDQAQNVTVLNDLTLLGNFYYSGQGTASFQIILAFGVSQTPLTLPADGVIPANWDSAGNPTDELIFKTGQGAIYNLSDPSSANYGDVYVFTGTTTATGWINVGPIVGPAGPTGEQGPEGPQGEAGPAGPQGPDGIQGMQGDQGIQGVEGPAGPQGPAGVGINVKGTVPTSADLPPTGNTNGDAYEAVDTGHLWVWATGTGWFDAGPIQGPAGPTGPQGAQGPAGQDGVNGATGATGPQGEIGPQGEQGVAGPPGPGGITEQSLTFIDNGGGGASGTSFNGSLARSISYNSVGAPSVTGSGASGTWNISISGNAASVSTVSYSAIINGLGFTPYNSTNPNGYCTLSQVAAQGYISNSGSYTWSQPQTFNGGITVGATGINSSGNMKSPYFGASSGGAGFSTTTGSVALNFTQYTAIFGNANTLDLAIDNGSGGYIVGVTVTKSVVTIGGILPLTTTYDAGANLGSPSIRWNIVYAKDGAINTSDANEKTEISDLSDAEKRVAVRLKGLIKKYKWKDEVAKKGDSARIHVGIIAQDVGAAFTAEGLDPHQYGVFCYDEWDAVPEQSRANGTEIIPATPAGSRYGVRYSELYAFIISSL